MLKWFRKSGSSGGPPDAAMVARRAHILATRIVHAQAWPPPDQLPAILAAGTAEQRDSLIRKFDEISRKIQLSLKKEAGVWTELSAEDLEFFGAKLLDRKMQHYINSSWAMESLACCLWTLELLPKLPAYDTQSDVLDKMPKNILQDSFRLRSAEHLERARAIAELWHWRGRTRQLEDEGHKLPPLPQGLTLDEIIKLASAEAAKAGDIPPPCDNDFPAFGKAYRDLSREECSLATSIAFERHRALNWICGRAPKNQWDKTPTDT